MIRTELTYQDRKLKINGEGEASVVVHTHPPIDEITIGVPFTQFFTSDGTESGSNDMRVNGATTNQVFYIGAQTDRTLYVKTVNVLIEDTGAALNEFGNLAELTNGVRFIWETIDGGDSIIKDNITTNLKFFELSGQSPAIVDLSGAGADAVVVSIDLAKVFGNPFGLRIKKGTTERLKFIIRDNLSTGITTYTSTGSGIYIKHD